MGWWHCSGTVTSFASIAALLGVDMSYARFFLAVAPGEANAVERFCWRFTTGMAIAISLAACVLWAVISGYADLHQSLAMMVAVGILLSVANNMSATRQRLLAAYRRIAGSILAAGVVGAALSILLALFWRSDEWALLVGAAGGTAVGIVVAGLPPFNVFAEPSGLPPSRRGEILKLAVAGVGERAGLLADELGRSVVHRYLPGAGPPWRVLVRRERGHHGADAEQRHHDDLVPGDAPGL